jgi:TrmH family RNA methyltransferase
MKHISSRDNPTFKLLRELAESARERRKQGRTVLDGIHLVQAYTEAVGLPELVAISEQGWDQGEIRRYIDGQPGVTVAVFADSLFRELSPVATPTGILALVPVPALRPLDRTGGSWVALDAVQDAGNVGSILRSAAAAGITEVVLGKGCAQGWSPKVLRAAMGAHFALSIHEHLPLEQALADYRGTIVTTRLEGGDSIFEADLSGPIAWVFGNEGTGVAPAVQALAQRTLHIPMSGRVESLNVAAAAAVCLFEERRQKLALSRRGGRA